MIERAFPKVQVRHASPNFSSREGSVPCLITVHATAGHNRQGISDLVGLGNWFDNSTIPDNQKVSSHSATDNEGHSARYVADRNKAWHCAAFNRVTLGLEQVIPGDGTELTEELYRESARWLAYWSRHNSHIPIQKGKVSGIHVVRFGVIRHSELGSAGGGHADPGNYDMRELLKLARHYRKLQVKKAGF